MPPASRCTLWAAALVVAATALPLRAGFTDPKNLTTPLLDRQGPRALPWELFRDQLSDVLRLGDPVQPSKLRLDTIARRDALLAKGRNSDADELIELGILHWRLREPEKALDALVRAKGADPRSYWALDNLGSLFQAMGQLQDAESHLSAALAMFPSPWPGTPAEGEWYRTAEKAQWTLLRSRMQEARQRPGGRPPVATDVDAIFPVRFVGPSGEYEAGRIADVEKEKLPPNAAAIVQQLLLWFPEDTRLLWLLGEIYNATGDIRAAEQVFDDCVGSRRFESPTLRERRRIIKTAVAELTPAVTPQEAFLPSATTLWLVGGIIGVIVLALILLQVRELSRRLFEGGSR